MLGWELPPHNSGGLGVACYELAHALHQEGVAVDFIMPGVTPQLQQLHGFMRLHGPAQTDQPPDPYRGDTDAIRRIQRHMTEYVEAYVAAQRPEAIHAHDWLTWEAGMRAKELTGAPLIAHVHATEYDRAGNAQGNPLIHDIEQQALHMADRIVAVSNYTRQLIVDRYHIPEAKIDVVHNGSAPASPSPVDSDTYTYLRTMQQEGYIVVASLGRLTIQKGLTHFLRAGAQASTLIDKFIFLVAGDGDQRDELISLSAELGIADRVIFTGFVRGEAWRNIHSLADVFVMSSVSEPFGLSALEAASHRTATIVTRQCGVGEAIDSFLRYDYWDGQRLADQLINLAISAEFRNELAENARRETRRLSWRSVAKKCLTQYHAVGVSA